jgi:hypothetical protein
MNTENVSIIFITNETVPPPFPSRWFLRGVNGGG